MAKLMQKFMFIKAVKILDKTKYENAHTDCAEDALLDGRVFRPLKSSCLKWEVLVGKFSAKPQHCFGKKLQRLGISMVCDS